MKKFVTILTLAFAPYAIMGHGNHKVPEPTFGPHGGDYAKMSVHYFEILSKSREVSVFILEPDLLSVAEDAVVLSISVRSQYGKYSKIKFQKKEKGSGRGSCGKGLVYFRLLSR